jgi:cation:H+ antiporter
MSNLLVQYPLLPFVLLAVGLAVLLIGAHYFVDGMAAIAGAFGVPPLIVGMTLVAFGTSTPELVINALSAYRGETGLAFGNIVGSSTVNIGVVLAATAMVRPLRVEASVITREIPMLWVAVSAMLILGSDLWLGGPEADALSRGDGLILLLLFGIFLYYTVIYSIARRALGEATPDAFMAEVAEKADRRPKAIAPQLAATVLGAAAVSLGASWTVDGATGGARLLGLSENLIGLTIVSFGTTLPELVTCIVAARRGNAEIALGNVVGSNLFNILAIGGVVSTIRPVRIPDGGHADLWFMALLSVVLLPVAVRSGRMVTRGEGALLLTIYCSFLVWRVTGA